MGNMGYCKFRNTVNDVRDCIKALEDREISSNEEKSAAKKLISEILDLCVSEEIIESYDKEAVEGIIEDCN